MEILFLNFAPSSILILDIDIDSEDCAVTDNCVSQIKPDTEKNIVLNAEESAKNKQTSNIQEYDEIDFKENASPEMQKNDLAREKDTSTPLTAKLHIDNGKTYLFLSIHKTILA